MAVRKIASCVAGSILIVLGLALPVAAQDLSDEQIAYSQEFTLNNTLFVLYHELGHMLVDQLDLPVLGREEDAVDNIASWVLLAEETEQADNALIDAADGWLLADRNDTRENFDDSDFYDEHSLNLQRDFAIVCQMVGADAEAFKQVADDYGLDAERQEGCAADYEQVDTSLIALFGPNIGDGGAEISVIYDEGGEDYGYLEGWLKDSGILEMAAQNIGKSFVLPNPITIVATTCGEENAFYSADELTVTMCYELMDGYVNMIVADLVEQNANAAGEGSSE